MLMMIHIYLFVVIVIGFVVSNCIFVNSLFFSIFFYFCFVSDLRLFDFGINS